MTLSKNLWCTPTIVLATLACSAEAQRRATSVDDCLSTVYHGQEVPGLVRESDRSFDINSQGRSFSCDLIVSATNARQVLEDFRSGVLYRERDKIARSVRFPLTVYINPNGGHARTTLTIHDLDEWVTFSDEKLVGTRLALISCASVRNVRIYRNRGFTIGYGMIWFTGATDDLAVSAINIGPATEKELLEFCGSVVVQED